MFKYISLFILSLGLLQDLKGAAFEPSKDASIESMIKYYANFWGYGNPELLIALAKHESLLNPRATFNERDGHVSYGLLQVKCSTAKWLGMGRNVPCEMLLQPSINILFAIKYLEYLEKRYAGDTFSVISAYNAGTARKHRNRFLNQMYVDKVLNNLVTKVD